MVPNGKGGFVKEQEKSWTAVEDPTKGELFINFGSKNESEAEANEGGSRAKRSRVKRTADGVHKNREDEGSALLVTVVTPKRSDKDKDSVSYHDVIRDIAASKPHYLGNESLRGKEVIEQVKCESAVLSVVFVLLN